MMLQHDTNVSEQLQYRNSVYTVFVELAEVTEALMEKTDGDEFEELQTLIQRREVCIRKLSEMHTMEHHRMTIYGSGDGQMEEIVSRVKQSSERMQSIMEQKSKSIVMKLSNLQNQRMYQQ